MIKEKKKILRKTLIFYFKNNYPSFYINLNRVGEK